MVNITINQDVYQHVTITERESLVTFYKHFTDQVEVTEEVLGPMIPAKMKAKSMNKQEKQEINS